MNAEVAKPGRLFQLLGGHCDLNTCLREIAGLQVLHGIESRAGTQRGQQQLWRRHAGVFAAILCWLVAENCVRPRLNGELRPIEMRNLYFHETTAFQ